MIPLIITKVIACDYLVAQKTEVGEIEILYVALNLLRLYV